MYLPFNANMVLISGKLMSGKTTLAKDLISLVGPELHHTPLALELKLDIASLPGITMEMIEEHKDIFRPILQHYGTNVQRHLQGEYYWVQRLKEHILSRYYSSVVVDDVRFSSELYGFDEAHPFKVRLEISPEEQVRRFRARFGKDPDPTIFTHASETALDNVPATDFDVVVGVDGLTTLQVRDSVVAVMRARGLEKKFNLPIDNSYHVGIY